MVIRSVRLSWTVRLAIASIPIHMVIVGLVDVIYTLLVSFKYADKIYWCGESGIFNSE